MCLRGIVICGARRTEDLADGNNNLDRNRRRSFRGDLADRPLPSPHYR